MDVYTRQRLRRLHCSSVAVWQEMKRAPSRVNARVFSLRLPTVALLLIVVVLPPCLVAQSDGNLDEFLKSDRVEYGQQLETLATQCDEEGLPDLAALIRNRIVKREAQRQYIFLPPAPGIELADSSTDEEKALLGRWITLGEGHADRLLMRARTAVVQSRGAMAYQLLHEALVANSDHAAIRKLLGFRQNGTDGWVKASEDIRINPGRRRQELIGWEKGTYQIIQSAHFTIYSADEEQGVKLARALEKTYDVWRQVWFEYWSSNHQLSLWLDGKGSDGASSRKHDVILFRDREQYLADLGEVEGIEISSGYYNETNRVSFFYNDDPAPLDTWRHEIVHQLLQETSGSKRSVADLGHAWLIEGIAMYFESMRDHGEYATLGGFDSLRLQFARLRATRESFFVPLEQLDAMDRQELQSSAEVRELYTQSAGMCQFLFVGNDEKYRDGFIEFVKRMYRGRAKPDGLADSTAALDQIDRQYREFLKVDPSLLAYLEENNNTEGLALAQSGLHSPDLQPLSRCKSLDWLQLSENRDVDDSGMEYLAALSQLTELYVDVTGITDKGLETVARIRSLEKLDIASTRITDDGLESVAHLPALRILWLGGTGVTDAGLVHLESLSTLRYIDLRQTKVTSNGVQRLKQMLPELEVVN